MEQAEKFFEPMKDPRGRQFIQSEALTARIEALINGVSNEGYSVGYPAILGALAQLTTQYQARIGLLVQQQSPFDLIAIHASVDAAQKAMAQKAAADLAASAKLPGKAPTKAPRPASEKKSPIGVRKLKSVK